MATKKMKLRRDGVCDQCDVALPAGVFAVYDSSSRSVRCVTHVELSLPAVSEEESSSETSLGNSQQLHRPPVLSRPPLLVKPAETEEDRPVEVDLEVAALGDGSSLLPVPIVGELTSTEEGLPAAESVAGSSARREYERRKAKDEAKIREQWGTLGGLAVALSSEKQTTKAWDKGAIGEEKLGRLLDSLTVDGITVLHDRRIPKTKANIDHIVVTAGGIWVVDAKRYTGRPELRVEGGLLRPRVEKLFVAGKDRTKLVEGVLWQVNLVAAEVGDVPVRGVLCFVDANWPMFGGSFIVDGVDACWPAHLAKLLKASAGDFDVSTLTAQLAAHFPPA